MFPFAHGIPRVSFNFEVVADFPYRELAEIVSAGDMGLSVRCGLVHPRVLIAPLAIGWPVHRQCIRRFLAKNVWDWIRVRCNRGHPPIERGSNVAIGGLALLTKMVPRFSGELELLNRGITPLWPCEICVALQSYASKKPFSWVNAINNAGAKDAKVGWAPGAS